jgi:hypothetical protein
MVIAVTASSAGKRDGSIRSRSMTADVSRTARAMAASGTWLSILMSERIEVGAEAAGVDPWRIRERFDDRRRTRESGLRNGVNAPTGRPLRVTTKDSPWSRRRMISPLSFRSSRWLIVVLTAAW